MHKTLKHPTIDFPGAEQLFCSRPALVVLLALLKADITSLPSIIA